MNMKEQDQKIQSRLDDLAKSFYEQNLHLGLEGIKKTKRDLLTQSDDKVKIRIALIRAYENDERFSDVVNSMRLFL